MRDLPTGPELRALADEWAAKVHTLSPDEQPVALAMIERCRAIAEREAAAGDAALVPMRAALAALYDRGGDADLARLAADIRAGKFDARGLARQRVRELLWSLTLQKLREGNPRFLAAHGID
ncbi:MAG TPA: DUF6285 domain-containing protein [Stellaceae bacterium]|nr:DUF6285 domain-containing protein [Stellaceae bacterium]